VLADAYGIRAVYYVGGSLLVLAALTGIGAAPGFPAQSYGGRKLTPVGGSPARTELPPMAARPTETTIDPLTDVPDRLEGGRDGEDDHDDGGLGGAEVILGARPWQLPPRTAQSICPAALAAQFRFQVSHRTLGVGAPPASYRAG
jgi:hypothetical protein